MFKPFLAGERIFLREVRISDVNERYYGWLNDPEVNQYLETRYFPRSFENITQFVKDLDGKAAEPLFAICLKSDQRHIGNIKMGPINWYHRYADVSLLIGEKEFWGKGYASEAIALVTKFGFETLNLNKLKAGCYAPNEGSARAFEKCGYSREGLIQQLFIHNGKPLDCILLGMTATKYFGEEKL